MATRPRDRLVGVGRVAERVLDVGRVDASRRAGPPRSADARPDDDRVAGGLVDDDVVLACPAIISWPRPRWAIWATRLPIVPLATNRPASLPSRSAARSSSALTVGSSPKTSSPTSASAMARRIAGRRPRDGVAAQVDGAGRDRSVMGGEYARHRRRGRPRDTAARTCYSPASPQLDPWCSGPTCQPVTLEIAGSNPVGSAITRLFLRPVRPPGRGVLSCPETGEQVRFGRLDRHPRRASR